MPLRFDCDDANVREWLRATFASGALPRRTAYGSAPDLIPYGEAYPDRLIDPADYKEQIRMCHATAMFPLYHQHATWAPPGYEWNQDGLPYCWAWGLTAALMDCRAREGKPTVTLSPVSLGWLVNWASRGNYLESAIRGARERGVCAMEYTPDPHSRNHRNYRDGWEDNALKHRIAEVWDLDTRSNAAMIQHSITVLATATPLYIAYNWWNHALQCCGLRWDESQPYNLVWQIRNSHNESDIIELTGSRAVPDEAYGIRATLTEV